ncbi:MAG TPA: hypothetical protein VFF30_18720 [Nitrososphaerales archaeon]|nr:hypothetical protein [Nitrososphaerales archaeon]
MRSLARVRTKSSFSSKLKDFADVLFYGPLSIIRHIWIQIILLMFMLGFGTIVFIHYQHLDHLTAFLGSVSTITTIGIYAPNIVGMTASEQILLIITFIVSVGLAASIVQSTITTAMKKGLLREQLVKKKIGRLEGHVIVAGYSYLGKYVTEWLEHLNVGHAVISRDFLTVRSTGLASDSRTNHKVL